MYEVLLAKTNTHNFDDKASYPHVRTLLQFDTREFLNVIALVCLCHNIIMFMQIGI